MMSISYIYTPNILFHADTATFTSQRDISRYNYCHMGRGMLYLLPYGKERETHDGGRTTPAAQRARLEPLQAHATTTRIPLCAEMEKRRGIYHVASQLARNHAREGTREDRPSLLTKIKEGFYRSPQLKNLVANLFPADSLRVGNKLRTTRPLAVVSKALSSLCHSHKTFTSVDVLA